jgi:hypothetical protein
MVNRIMLEADQDGDEMKNYFNVASGEMREFKDVAIVSTSTKINDDGNRVRVIKLKKKKKKTFEYDDQVKNYQI